jgi:hypothetical protein
MIFLSHYNQIILKLFNNAIVITYFVNCKNTLLA